MTKQLEVEDHGSWLSIVDKNHQLSSRVDQLEARVHAGWRRDEEARKKVVRLEAVVKCLKDRIGDWEEELRS